MSIFHPKLEQINDFAVLSVASFHEDFGHSAFFDYISKDNWEFYPQEVENYNGFSSNDEKRTKAIELCFSKTKFVLASRGGYGTIRSLINCNLSNDTEGILIGFSDLTVMINYFSKNY